MRGGGGEGSIFEENKHYENMRVCQSLVIRLSLTFD